MKFLLALLILTLPLGVITRLKLFGDAYVNVQDIIVGLIFIFVVFNLLTKKVRFYNDKIILPLFGFLGVGFVSLLLDYKFLGIEHFLISFLYLLRFICYSFLVLAIYSLKSAEKKLIIVLLTLSGFVFTLFGFVQYFLYGNLRNLYYAGWDDHLYRLFSTLLDPNFAGIFIVLGFILVLDRIFTIKTGRIKLFFYFIAVLELVAIYLTYSRSAFVALVVGIFSLLYISGKRNLLVPSILIIALGLVFFSNTKIEGLNPFRTASSFARIETTKQAVNIFVNNPILGVGFDSFRYAQIRYGYRSSNLPIPSNADAGTDNSYLFVLVTTGLIGFAFFAKCLIENILQLKNGLKKVDMAKVGLSSLLAVVVSSLFINALFYPLIMCWLFIVLGLSFSSIDNKK